MLRLIRTLLALLGVVAVTMFALANRAPVTVDLLVLQSKLEVPLYALFLGGLVVGCLLGAVATWLGQMGVRREARRLRRRVTELTQREQGQSAAEARSEARTPALARAA